MKFISYPEPVHEHLSRACVAIKTKNGSLHELTKENLLRNNPFLTEEEVQKIVDNPPKGHPPEDRDLMIP